MSVGGALRWLLTLVVAVLVVVVAVLGLVVVVLIVAGALVVALSALAVGFCTGQPVRSSSATHGVDLGGKKVETERKR